MGIQKTYQQMQDFKTAQLASKSAGMGALLGFFFGGFGYLYIGEIGWCLLNLFTFNFCFLGIIIVPFHIHNKITAAQEMVAVG